MKTVKISICIALCLVLIYSAFVSAVDTAIGAKVEYGDVDLTSTLTVEAYTLSPTVAGSHITINNAAGRAIETEEIVFTNEAGSEGVYYKDGSRYIRIGSEATFVMQRNTYTIKHLATGSRALSDTGIATGAYRLSASANYMSTGSDPFVFFNMAFFPDDGSDTVIRAGDTFASADLPFMFVFNSRASGRVTALTEEEISDVETSTAERGASEGAVPEEVVTALGGEAGCIDNDAEEDNPLEVESYVSVVRADGSAMVVTDYCVESDDSVIYEASCTDGEARVSKMDCPADKPCSRGACRGEGTITKFCIDSDRSPRTTEAGSSYKPAMEREVTTTSNTIGYYAATEGGKEFGAWNDYCRDDKTLIEYYCAGTGATSTTGLFREIICPKGCADGRCVNPPYCFDSDGGQNENVKGKVRVITAASAFLTHEDVCKDGSTVTEYYCNKDNQIEGFASADKACGEGKSCSNGKCVAAGTITDCKRCDTLNKFNIWVGTSCNEDGTPVMATAKLTRCASGTYCDTATNACIAEPIATESDVINSLNRRKTWAVLLDESSWWLENVIGPAAGIGKANGEVCTTPEECTSKICAIDPSFSIAMETMEHPKESIKIRRLCAAECKQDEDCVSGKVCSKSGTTAGQCVATSSVISRAGTKANGEACTSNADCTSGFCKITKVVSSGSLLDRLRFGSTSNTKIKECAACTTNTDCGTGRVCTAEGICGDTATEPIVTMPRIPAYNLAGYLTDIKDISSRFKGLNEAGPTSLDDSRIVNIPRP